MTIIKRWKQKARQLKVEVFTLYFACRDPRTPWYAKALAVIVVAYAFSPIDLIPDFIPVLGHIDDIIILPIGVLIVRSMIPHKILEECNARALKVDGQPKNWVAAGVIIALWICIAAAAILLLWRRVPEPDAEVVRPASQGLP